MRRDFRKIDVEASSFHAADGTAGARNEVAAGGDEEIGDAEAAAAGRELPLLRGRHEVRGHAVSAARRSARRQRVRVEHGRTLMRALLRRRRRRRARRGGRLAELLTLDMAALGQGRSIRAGAKRC